MYRSFVTPGQGFAGFVCFKKDQIHTGSTFSDIQGNGTGFFVVQEKCKINNTRSFAVQVADGKNEVRDRAGVSRSLNINIAADRLHVHLAVKIADFNAEGMAGKFPKIETDADYHRKLGVDAGEIAGNDRVKSPHNGQFSAAFLGKIAKCEEFNLHGFTLDVSFFIMIATQ